MKIVQIIDTLNVGGAERVLVTLANLLHRKEHEVTVITLLEPGPLAVQLLPDIPIRSLRRGWKWNVMKMLQLVRWCQPFDIIHVHSSHNLRYVFLAFTLFFLKKRIVYQEHFGAVDSHLLKWHQKWIIPQTMFVAVSSKIKKWAIEALKIPLAQVHLLENTVPKYELNHTEKKSNNTHKILIVSNFLSAKNIDFGIDILSHLKQKKNFELTIIGKVADRDYYQKIVNKIKILNLKEQVHFIHDCNYIQPILNNYDIGLHVSKSESGPLVLIEYLAQGLPFIAYQTGEVVATVQQDLPEHILPHFEVATWVKRIEEILLKDQNYLRKRLVSTYDSHFSEEVYYQKCLKIYQESLNY